MHGAVPMRQKVIDALLGLGLGVVICLPGIVLALLLWLVPPASAEVLQIEIPPAPEEEIPENTLTSPEHSEFNFIYDQAFLECEAFVLDIEGKPSNDKYDKGGYTKHGVSQLFMKSIKKHAELQDVKDLSFMEALDLMYKYFWLKCRCNDLPRGLDLLVYDTAVHCGESRAIKYLQKAVGVKEDGVIRTSTVIAARKVNFTQAMEVILQERAKLYYRKTQYDYRQKKFIPGWFNRLERLKKAAKNRNI